MAGPAIAVIAGVLTFWLAVKSNDGLVSDDYYKEGLAVNQQLHRDQGASKLGLHADLMRSGVKLRLLLRREEGAAGDLPEAVFLKIAHPTQAGRDQRIKMLAQANGFYSGDLQSEITGRWIVSLEDPGGRWRLQGEWLADSDEPLRLMAKAGH